MLTLQIQSPKIPENILLTLASKEWIASMEELLNDIPNKSEKTAEVKKELLTAFLKIVTLKKITRVEFETFNTFFRRKEIIEDYVKKIEEVFKKKVNETWEEYDENLQAFIENLKVFLPIYFPSLSFRAMCSSVLEDSSDIEKNFESMNIDMDWYKLYKEKNTWKYVLIYWEWEASVFYYDIQVNELEKDKPRIDRKYITIREITEKWVNTRIFSTETKKKIYEWNGEIQAIGWAPYYPVGIIDYSSNGGEKLLLSSEWKELFRTKLFDDKERDYIYIWKVDDEIVMLNYETDRETYMSYELNFLDSDKKIKINWLSSGDEFEDIVSIWWDFLIIFKGRWKEKIYSVKEEKIIIEDIDKITEIIPFPSPAGTGVIINGYKKGINDCLDEETGEKMMSITIVPWAETAIVLN